MKVSLFTDTTEEVTSILNTITNNVFPLCAVEGTKIPFIIYRRTGTQTLTLTKDGMNGTEMSFDVDVVTERYSMGLTLLDALHKTLRSKFPNIVIQNSSELFDDQQNLYIQQISFTITVEN